MNDIDRLKGSKAMQMQKNKNETPQLLRAFLGVGKNNSIWGGFI
jgi:hypothetical protein